jgi:hypothetical protein
MKTACGHLRKLTDRQIRAVLKWHQASIEFRRSHGTLRDLAGLLGVSLRAVRGCFEIPISASDHSRPLEAFRSPSGLGRPRHLNPAEIAFAFAWREASRRFRAQHGTAASLARELGVGTSTIHDCIRRQGRYSRRAQLHGCPATRRAPVSDNAVRAALLRAWLRPKPTL